MTKKISDEFDFKKLKSRQEINRSLPIRPKGLWWKEYLSNLIFLQTISLVTIIITLPLMLLLGSDLLTSIYYIIIASPFVLSFIVLDNIGPVFSDKYFGIHYYKKRKFVWDKWWALRWKYERYKEQGY